jgi:hypothetical protein
VVAFDSEATGSVALLAPRRSVRPRPAMLVSVRLHRGRALGQFTVPLGDRPAPLAAACRSPRRPDLYHPPRERKPPRLDKRLTVG